LVFICIANAAIPEIPAGQSHQLIQTARTRKDLCQNSFMAAHKLNSDELQTVLQKLPGWTIKDGKLHREYQFADFPNAIGFITIAAIGIEKMNHHPEWFNVYNRVRVYLTTHDSGGITQKDADLAQMLEQIAQKLT
jgi:4a-hydroxytetrahydrobiopterin dehydratase